MKKVPVRRRIQTPVFGGDMAQRRLSQALQLHARRIDEIGLLATPDLSLVEILSLQGVGGSAYDPIRVLLSEGEWTFPPGGFTTSRNNVHLIALTPGHTVFRREGVPTAPLLTMGGNNCVVSGLYLKDDDTTTTHPVLTVDGLDMLVERCRLSGGRAIDVESESRVRIQNNYVSVSVADKAIWLRGSAVGGVVSGNILRSSSDTFIYADDGVTETSFVGNVSSETVLDYKAAGTGNVQAGNVGTVNAR